METLSTPSFTFSSKMISVVKNYYQRFQPFLMPVGQALFARRHALVYFLFAIYLFNSIGLLKGGNMHPEAEAFIYNYLEPYRTTGEKIFDSILNDWGFYQSREMTYITEWLDAYFVKAGILLGFPFFYSVVFYLFIALASYIHYQGCRRYLGLSSTTSALILGIFWFSPSIFASGYLFRTAKIGAAACIIVMAWSLYALLRHPRRSVEDPLENTDSYSPLRRLLIAIGLFALAFIASLYDRQGFFMMIIFWIITTLILILGNQRYARLAFFSIGGAIALAVLWNQILSPTLILYFNGYIPDMAWQRITQNDLLRYNQEIGSSPFFDGLFVFTDILRFVIGNFGTAQILILILLALAYTYTLHTPHMTLRLGPFAFTVRRFHFIFLIISLAALLLMATLMILKHHPVAWQDMRRSYYHIPATAIILLLLTYFVYLIQHHQTLKKQTLQIALTAILIFNLIELPIHSRFYLTGHSAPRIKESKDFLMKLRKLDEDIYGPTTGFTRSNFYRYFRQEYRRFHNIPDSPQR
jgi:hypothetical protein